jgi:hypothetical protein
MRTFGLLVLIFCASSSTIAAAPAGPSRDVGKEMAHTLALLDKSFGLESYPPPHCLTWGYGHQITPDEVRACAAKALAEAPPELGKKYVVAVLMADIGPQTMIAVSLETPGWAVLSCDPGKPCPPRHAGTDKLGKRVVDLMQRACASDKTVWLPEKKGCP